MSDLDHVAQELVRTICISLWTCSNLDIQEGRAQQDLTMSGWPAAPDAAAPGPGPAPPPFVLFCRCSAATQAAAQFSIIYAANASVRSHRLNCAVVEADTDSLSQSFAELGLACKLETMCMRIYRQQASQAEEETHPVQLYSAVASPSSVLSSLSWCLLAWRRHRTSFLHTQFSASAGRVRRCSGSTCRLVQLN